MDKSAKVKVLSIVRHIPEGSVMSYSEVATEAGMPKASRYVGKLMKENFDPSVPCHRVVRKDGRVGKYNRGGVNKKIEILKSEGVEIKDGRVSRQKMYK